MPFCPKCRSEYREGFSVCADCQVPLVDKLSTDEETTEYNAVPTEVDATSLKYVTVFVADEPQEAATVRGILSENKMPYITRGEEETKSKYVEFLVKEDKLEEAQNLLKGIIEQESQGIEPVLDYPEAEEKTEEKDTYKAADLKPQGPAKGILIGIFLIGIVAIGNLPHLKNQDKLLAAGILTGVFILIFLGFFRDKKI